MKKKITKYGFILAASVAVLLLFSAVIAAAPSVPATAQSVTQSLELNVTGDSWYAFPLAVDGVPLPADFILTFDPEKIIFAGVPQSDAILQLPAHDPEEGVVAFTYLGGASTDNPDRAGIVTFPHFYAWDSGVTQIEITAFASESNAEVFDGGELSNLFLPADFALPSEEAFHLEPFTADMPIVRITPDSTRESRSEFGTALPFSSLTPLTPSELEELLRSLPDDELPPPVFNEPIVIGEIGAFSSDRSREFSTDFLPTGE